MEDPTKIDLDKKQCDELVRRLKENELSEEDRELLVRVVNGMVWLSQALESKTVTLKKLWSLFFGKKTEKAKNILKDDPAAEPDVDVAGNTAPPKPPPLGNAPGNGHGRRPASDYPGATHTFCSHPELKCGNRCPKCGKGRLHDSIDNGIFIRFKGNPPITAEVYETEKLRCGLCGAIFEAPLPADVPPVRWDETAKAMTALLRYGYGVPHFRQERLQGNLGIPLADSCMFEKSEEVADDGFEVYRTLVTNAAQGTVLNLDDTGAKILELMKENESRNKDKERVGIFTSACVSKVGDHEIALFFTGRDHAGENVEKLLAKRQAGMAPPILMVDGSSRNIPEKLIVIMANCLTHGRRAFVPLCDDFPDEVRHVILEIAKLYHHDETAREQGMSDEERLRYHQEHSAPVIESLKIWSAEQFDKKLVEPNSELGKAIKYLQKRWQELTVFLRVPGAPISNDIVERLIKRYVLHRKNSLFYKTLHGAAIGDILMTLIHTAVRNSINPFDYLTELQRNKRAVKQDPNAWLPWTYQATLAKSTPSN
jgi:hypothetical protein